MNYYASKSTNFGNTSFSSILYILLHINWSAHTYPPLYIAEL